MLVEVITQQKYNRKIKKIMNYNNTGKSASCCRSAAHTNISNMTSDLLNYLQHHSLLTCK